MFRALLSLAAFALIASAPLPVTAQEDTRAPPKQDKPLTDYSKTQIGNAEEVSEKFGTSVDQTILDRGDGEVQQRDRLGSGRAGVFYDHRSDDRLNDSDDTIGVQLKLFDLND